MRGGATEYAWGPTIAEIDTGRRHGLRHYGSMAVDSAWPCSPKTVPTGWIMADLAVIHSGNVTVPLFTTHATATAEYILDFTETKVLFLGQTENWEGVKTVLPSDCLLVTLPGVDCELPHKTWDEIVASAPSDAPNFSPDGDDVVSLVFTSGTTGLPKGRDTDPCHQSGSNAALPRPIYETGPTALFQLPTAVTHR